MQVRVGGADAAATGSPAREAEDEAARATRRGASGREVAANGGGGPVGGAMTTGAPSCRRAWLLSSFHLAFTALWMARGAKARRHNTCTTEACTTRSNLESSPGSDKWPIGGRGGATEPQAKGAASRQR